MKKVGKLAWVKGQALLALLDIINVDQAKEKENIDTVSDYSEKKKQGKGASTVCTIRHDKY